ncbi:universal stress protein PHOS32-like [Cucumis melo var. makuwa]|uniref:Universal stress protein PHOS32-like n=1 Tax=Cucumis melo var. makuwa TaxID=1194695 RepID=A0A5A7SWZ0_CUCMM|nr:universal stress protein PHOS32-like [Cucumis melo var. makuwa]TYK22357.1 universal stress protein PHOS32-like [Cucumis melo var. makuwa]
MQPGRPAWKIGMAVDLSDWSEVIVRFTTCAIITPRDQVFLIHVQQQPVSPTDFNHGIIMDRGNIIGAQSSSSSTSSSTTTDPPTKQQEDAEEEKHWDDVTKRKMNELAKYLIEAKIEFVMHVVKDSEVKERLAWEINRLGINFVVLGFQGHSSMFSTQISMCRMGSVALFCSRHCPSYGCQVVLARHPPHPQGTITLF